VVQSIVDAASYETTVGEYGQITTIFGTNLAATTASAPSLPLPRQLGGTTVTWNGVAAPLFYVSPTQVNFQVPSQGDTTPGVGTAMGAVVSTASGNSQPYYPYTVTPNAWASYGLFSADASGCGQAAALTVAADGSTSPNSPSNSATQGGYVTLFGTDVDGDSPNYPWYDGEAAPSNPPVALFNGPGGGFAQLDLESAPGSPLNWIGLAPGFVGLGQYNLQIPNNVRDGCAVPIQAYLSPSGITPLVTVAIHHGGGPCVDPPQQGFGDIVIEKHLSYSPPHNVTQAETLTVSLQSSPGKQAPPAPVFQDTCTPPRYWCYSLANQTVGYAPACPVPGYDSLAAGSVSASGPGLPATPVPSAPYQDGYLGGLSAYQLTLPNGAIQQGTFNIAASGGKDVGPFQAALPVGAEIGLLEDLNGVVMFNNCENFVLTWEGGDPKSWITVSIIGQEQGYESSTYVLQTPVAKGQMIIPQGPVPCGASETPALLRIEVDPDPSEIVYFSAPGLSLGGRARWKYVYEFQVVLFGDE
jgi:uncharacterized protein (TIGR03437 family)